MQLVLKLEIQLTIKISEKTKRRFGVILAPLSSKECNRKWLYNTSLD